MVVAAYAIVAWISAQIVNVVNEPLGLPDWFDAAAVNPTGRFLPEVDPMHYLPYVTLPVLMLNSELDNLVPLESAAKPFFEQLGTPAENKRQIIVPGGHFVPQDVLIRETLKWYDELLGHVKRGS